MSKKANLDSGFLLLYDWLPALEELPAKEVKALLFALIARQRESTPLPIFKNKMTNSFARMIEPVIKRRLDGQTGGKRGQACPQGSTPPPSPQREEEMSKEKISKDNCERSKREIHTSEAACLAPQGSALSEEEAEQLKRESPSPGSALSEAERQELLAKGVPESYIGAREVRATDYALSHQKTVFATLLHWWQEDAAKGIKAGGYCRPPKKEDAAALGMHSFEADEFFRAALNSTYGDLTG